MPITVTRDDAKRRFTAVGEGVLTRQDITGFMAEHRVGAYRRYGLLFDLRGAEVRLSAADVRVFAEMRDPLRATEGDRGPVAIVATEPSVYGLVRMYESLAELRLLQVVRGFQSVDEAVAWLNLLLPIETSSTG